MPSLPGSDESLCNGGRIELVFSFLVGFNQKVLTWYFELFGYDLIKSFSRNGDWFTLSTDDSREVHNQFSSSELIASAFLPFRGRQPDRTPSRECIFKLRSGTEHVGRVTIWISITSRGN